MSLHDLWEEALPDLDLAVPFDLRVATKAVFRVGSHSHGTYIPPEHKFGVDDVDLMVIVCPPPQFKLGIKTWEHGEFKHGKWDIVLYDWQKWLHMMRKSNPNVVGTLWLEQEDIYLPNFHSPVMYHIVDSRHSFLSKQMYPAFVGYAKGQLYKMTHHAHQGYMGDKRKRLVEEFGYDVKNAAHMIRLLRMACEAFELHKLIVRRDDAQELIDIKSGRWSLEQVQEEAEFLFEHAEALKNASSLREYPNDAVIQSFMLQGYKETWGWRS